MPLSQEPKSLAADYTEDRHAWLDDLTWEQIQEGLAEAREELRRMGLRVEPIEPTNTG